MKTQYTDQTFAFRRASAEGALPSWQRGDVEDALASSFVRTAMYDWAEAQIQELQRVEDKEFRGLFDHRGKQFYKADLRDYDRYPHGWSVFSVIEERKARLEDAREAAGREYIRCNSVDMTWDLRYAKERDMLLIDSGYGTLEGVVAEFMGVEWTPELGDAVNHARCRMMMEVVYYLNW